MDFKQPNFPYGPFKERLIECFSDGLRDQGIAHLSKDLVELHLQDDMQAMPNISYSTRQSIFNQLEEGGEVKNITSQITLEDASTKTGMLRVLVRTRMNSTGINNVSRGNLDGGKTLSPRILDFIETINLEHRYSPEELVDTWLDFANSSHPSDNPGANYEKRDIAALQLLKDALRESSGEGNIRNRLSAPKLNKLFNHEKEITGFYGWVAIVATVVSGLHFLQDNNWEIYHKATKNLQLDHGEVVSLIREVETNVVGFRYALAGSYLADMGGINFIKDDTHVRSFVTALVPHLRDAESRVQYVFSQSHLCGLSPRALDKAMYMAGSGYMPLLDLKLKHSEFIKNEMLELLEKYAS